MIGEAADALVVAPTFGPRCALCWERFHFGEAYRSIWPKVPGGAVTLGISVHPSCAAELDSGDLHKIFEALRKRLAAPIAVLNGRRVELVAN